MRVVMKPDLSHPTASHTIVKLFDPSLGFIVELQLELDLTKFSLGALKHLAL